MQIVEQIAAVVPYGETVLHKAEGAYDYSMNKTVQVYNDTKGKIIETKKGYVEFKKNFEKAIVNIAQETVNEVLLRCEGFLGVKKSVSSPQDLKHIRERLQILFQTLFTEYVLKSRLMTNDKVQGLIKMGQNYSVEYLVPLYINIKATLIVTWEMLIEFLESRLKDIKLTYETSKDHVVMFVSGSFNEENLKQKVFEGLDKFKSFTVQVVNKGLQIRVDRQSLVENYDKFAVNFLEVVKQMREKGEGEITEMKKKSKDLYKQAVRRIRAKELQIKTQIKTGKPYLLKKC